MLAALPLLLTLLATTVAPPSSATSATSVAAPIAARVEAASSPFLGRPYVRAPLGEGEGPAPRPRFRTDAFDCLTLVETAIALAYGGGEPQTRLVLDDIRYGAGSPVAYSNRLHLMEAQWIPDMIRKGYLEEATATYGGDAVRWTRLPLDPSRWSARTLLRPLAWNQAWEGEHAVPLLPLEEALRIAATLPEGLVVNVVRQPKEGAITYITHTGLLVIRDGKRFVRHAALRERRVIDEPLDAFLQRHRRMRTWPVAGVHLLEVRDNQSRVDLLLAADRVATSAP